MDTHMIMICMSIADALMASFAMFPTVFKTHEMGYIHLRQKKFSKDISNSEIPIN